MAHIIFPRLAWFKNLPMRLLLTMTALSATLALHAQQPTFTPSAHYTERVTLFSRLHDIGPESVVMMGNSLTENAGDWNYWLHSTGVVNRGIIGDDAEGMRARHNELEATPPKTIVLMCGINDLSHHLTADSVFTLVSRLVADIRKRVPSAHLYVQSLLPINESFGRWKNLKGRTDDVPRVNSLLDDYCRSEKIDFINVFPKMAAPGTNTLQRQYSVDGLHLSAKGYAVWAGVLRKYLQLEKQP